MERVDNKYSNDLEEVFVVLEELDLLKALPSKFIIYIMENKNNEYEFEYDVTKELVEQNLSKDAQKILTIIYHDFLCNEEEKKELMKKLRENGIKSEEELNKKYGYEKMFPPKKENVEKKPSEKQLVKYHDSIFSKIINKIKNIFKRH